MKALLDTNIIIHRETAKVVEQDIGVLYRWLDRVKYTKTIHPITVNEIKKFQVKEIVESFARKMESYEHIKFPSPLQPQVQLISEKSDTSENDRNDTMLLNEVFIGRVDILITQDKKIHRKAAMLGIEDHVFNIDGFLEKVVSEHPELVNYKVLSVRKKHFGELDLNDPFFDSFKEDYPGFEKWFIGKSDEEAYVSINTNTNKIAAFLYLKVEDKTENYHDISPPFKPIKRLKIGTFKVVSNGFRLGERFLKIVFDNALANKVNEIYVTIFDKRDEQRRLIQLLSEWGFTQHGKKNEELVFVRHFSPSVNNNDLKLTYPYFDQNRQFLLVPIYPEYHTDLLPDSFLNNEKPDDFIDDLPHRNAINKVYVSRSFDKNVNPGDVLIFYRTGGYYESVVTTIGIVDDVVDKFADKDDFIRQCLKRSVYPEDKLSEIWDYKKNPPFIVRFLYVYSFPRRINMKAMIDNGVLSGVDDAPRGFKPISKEKFRKILELTNSDESFIID